MIRESQVLNINRINVNTFRDNQIQSVASSVCGPFHMLQEAKSVK